MKSQLVKIFPLAVVLLFAMVPGPTYAQGEKERNKKAGKMDLPEETEGEIERREEAERKKEVAAARNLSRREVAERLRRAEEMFPDYYNEHDRKEAREHFNRKLRLNDFLKDVDRFQRAAVRVRACAFSPMSRNWAVKDLEKHSKEFEKMTEQLRELIDYGLDPPPVEVAPLRNESLENRLRRLARMTNRLIPRMVTLTTGDILDLEMQRSVRQELASLTALGRALGN